MTNATENKMQGLLTASIVISITAIGFSLISMIIYILKFSDPDSVNLVFIVPLLLAITSKILMVKPSKNEDLTGKNIKTGKNLSLIGIISAGISVILFIISYIMYVKYMDILRFL